MSRLSCLLTTLCLGLLTACGGGGSGGAAGSTAVSDSGAAGIGQTLTLTLPASGLAAADLGVIVAEGDAVSEAMAAAYVAARGVPAANVIRVKVNTAVASLSAAEFLLLKSDIDARLPASVQATLLAWAAPSRVTGACSMGITSAMALGYDTRWCNPNPSTDTCATTAASPLFDRETRRPQADAQVRPSMLLGTSTLAAAQALIGRGVASDATRPAGEGWLVRTNDSARSVRWTDFQPLPAAWSGVLALNYVDNSSGAAAANSLAGKADVLFYLTGLTQVANLSTLQFRPGALADALTSVGGLLPGGGGQMPITAWLDAGATASYGTVEEPCNHTQKFSRASVLIDHYWRGATAIEAYWKAVEWPGQGLFIGEPLAQPFRDAPSFAIVAGEYQIKTRSLRPGSRYALQYRLSGSSTWTTLASFTGTRGQMLDGRAPLPPAAAVQIRWQGPCPTDAASSCTLAQSP
ncbi:TIGR03790 family protein [Pelomonas sp. UHG3]|uniref:TIGR03790 family protein n=1 Tax=Roseateles hydrophilus TaxID=2975054 RepID=A0ACC6CC86_9BURK|nr:TIGR03790 family protein [Pelomonas sp. UHG3]MCY4746063.1 TIGR03790 family protein [Pelomonas sp. UHG3]